MQDWGIIKVMQILKKEAKNFANPIVTEIGEKTRSPFMVLVSCLLSLRTNDKITGPVSKNLFKIADTPEKINKLPLKKLKKIIKSVNFYITKSKRIKEISKTLLEKYNGKVPGDFDELMKFKGVGRKTANIVMTYGFFKKEYIAVDTHVHRIPNRLGWVKTKNPHQTEEELKKIILKKYWQDINDIFVTFGQNICKPISPHCRECPINQYCKYYKEVYLPKSG
ncbi:endonuclease III [Candidatus Woesearchaeota archaeon]|nr:endonuclease III [Candidatus Woesearchaeota archaeon]